MKRNVLFKVLLVSILFLLSACAVHRPAQEKGQGVLRWPPPPQPARIEWVKEIRTPEDSGVAKGFWERVSEKVSGVKTRTISKPYGVHADENGRLVVVDTDLAAVHLFDLRNNKYRLLGAEQGYRFQAPIAVSEDDRDNLYITDAGAGLVYRYRLQDGSLEKFSPFKLKRPTGIAFSRKQRLLFVSDTLAHKIIVYDLAGQELRRIGKRGDGHAEFNYPTDLFVDHKGQLYVTDALNQRIQVLTPEGQLLAQFGEGGDKTGFLAKPKGVAVDSQGHIYVCDALLDAVQIFDSTGRLLLYFGGTGSRIGEFWMPTGISIDSQDNIYVADSFNRRVQVFRYLDAGQGKGEKR